MAELTKVNINTAEYDIHDAKPHGELTAPLVVQGGDVDTAGKIKLDQTRSGQITNNDTSTLFGFMDTSNLTIGSSTYNMRLRGKETRPKYNNNNMALYSDLPSSPVVGQTQGYTIVVSSSAPASGTANNIITIVI